MSSVFNSLFANQLQDFLDFKTSLGFSLNSYQPHAKNFDAFCIEHYPKIYELTSDIVFAWVCSGRKDNKVMPEKVRFARAFSNYLVGIGQTAYVLPSEFTPKENDSMPPYLFSDTEMTDFFREVDRIEIPGNEFSSTILSVYFRLVYTCGLRPGEARKLQVKDVNIETGEINITHTKNSVDRIVVMSEAMRELCDRYSAIRNVLFSDNEFFFPNSCGDCLSDDFYQRHFIQAFAKAHPSTPKSQLPFVRVYNLRHQFASVVIHNWLNNGENLENKLPYLQAYMGHSDISQTAYYVHLLPEKLQKNHGINWAYLNSIIPEVDTNE